MVNVEEADYILRREMEMLEQRLYLSELFNIYGPLLTEKQQRCLTMHLFDDFSLSEIGADLQVSRQAVYDILHRSEQTMMEYEEKLGLAKRIQDERQVLDKVYDEISKLADTADAGRVKDILEQLAPYVSAAQEE